eukprot:TRINITY_DN4155_c0_g1_i1.p1 TRINITY_DN4155_c0_g1~~TRINITY_DN4155_c0_g1_i1.p1  ORF type:complete len:487 (+),score=164.90 TRINITY_DN4155_c0_g1_i1:530-1990(+)
MAFPLRSSVTYLSDHGGPTVVFNQSMSADLASRVPDAPEQGALSWPQRGKHITFRGSCYHQVRGDRALGLALPEDAEVRRLTLLVNWWDHRVPVESDFTPQWAAARGRAPPPTFPAHPGPVEKPAATHRFDSAADASGPGVVAMTTPLFPSTTQRRGEQAFRYAVPTTGACRETCVVDWSSHPSAAQYYPSVLDVTNRFVFSEAVADVKQVPERLASVIYVAHPDRLLPPAGPVDMARALRALERRYEDGGVLKVMTYVADPTAVLPFLGMFHVDLARLPCVVVLTKRGVVTRHDFQPGASQDEAEARLQSVAAEALEEGHAAPPPLERHTAMGPAAAAPFGTGYLTHAASQVGSYEDLEGRCGGRAMERLMLTSRGGPTVCVVFLPAAEGDAVPAAFEAAWQSWAAPDFMMQMTHVAWEYFHAAPGTDVPAGLQRRAAAPLPTARPLFAVYEAERGAVKVMADPDAGAEAYADWLKDAAGLGSSA